MKVKTEPLAIVARKPVRKGRKRKSLSPICSIDFTTNAATKAPVNSLAILPRGKADLEEGTSVRPATKPIPSDCEKLGFVRLIVMEYMAMVQLGVTPPIFEKCAWYHALLTPPAKNDVWYTDSKSASESYFSSFLGNV